MSLPIMNCWTYEDVKMRMVLEEKSGGYGKGWIREAPDIEQIKQQQQIGVLLTNSTHITEEEDVPLIEGQDLKVEKVLMILTACC